MQALRPTLAGKYAREITRQAQSTVADEISQSEPATAAKPRWARKATTKGEFAPEVFKSGTRHELTIPRTKRWAAK